MKRNAIVIGLLVAAGASAADMGAIRKMDDNQFVALPGFPACMTQAVQSGDPSKGPSVILFKGTKNCTVPWHWHTPNEQVMLASGTARVEMKDGASKLIGEGGFALMPSKHVHRFTCVRACVGFVAGDAAFDIHYVDMSGAEIAPDAALAPADRSARKARSPAP
jgi:quercetin dioxygenase-like cupin family protein